MTQVIPFPPPSGRDASTLRDTLVVAYVNASPSAFRPAPEQQLAAIRRRARRDGVAIGLLLTETEPPFPRSGRGRLLDETLAAAWRHPERRILYVADTGLLAACPGAVVLAVEDLAATGFHVRAPCGHVSPTGRTMKVMRAAARGAPGTAGARREARPILRGARGASSETPDHTCVEEGAADAGSEEPWGSPLEARRICPARVLSSTTIPTT